MASESWLRRRLSMALFAVFCAGCSRQDGDRTALAGPLKPAVSNAVAAPSKPDAAAQETIRSPVERVIVERAKTALQPTITALGTYHQQHGRYPATLDELVRASLLPQLPALPPAQEAIEKRLEYRASLRPDFFVLLLRYEVEFAQGNINIRDQYCRFYAADDRRGWIKPGSPFVSIEELIADRLAPLWREKHEPEILARFVGEVIGAADCEYLLERKVIAWLGTGFDIKVPPEVFGPGKSGTCYQPQGQAVGRYCFVYKNHWFGHFSCPSVGPGRALAKGPLVFSNMPVLDKLFVITRQNDGTDTWELLRACPASDGDHPPKASRGTVVLDETAAPEPSASNPVTAIMTIDPPGAFVGETVEVRIHIRIASAHFIHAKDDARGPFVPVEVKTELPAGVEPAGEWQFPTPETGREQALVYRDSVVLRRSLRVVSCIQPATPKLLALVQYQVCNDEVCWPKGKLELTAALTIQPPRR